MSLLQSSLDISLHAQHIRLARSMKFFDPTYLFAAQEMLTAHFPARDGVLMLLIKQKEKSLDMKEVEPLLVCLSYTQEQRETICVSA